MQHHNILLETGTNELELLTFMVKDQTFGVNVAKVKSILQYDPGTITYLPDSHPAVIGMMTLREKAIPLINLSIALKRSGDSVGERQIVIVFEFNEKVTSFRVDSVRRIHRLYWKEFVPINTLFSKEHASVVGTVSLEDTEVLVLDFEKIVAEIFPDMALQEANEESLHAPQATRREDVRIFFAEDSKIIRSNVVRVLKKVGYNQIRDFENGQLLLDALREILAKPGDNEALLPNLVLTDIEMPMMDGLTLCKQIKEDLKLKIPVFMFSSLINEQMIIKCQSVGADNYISKPETNKLIGMLDAICLPDNA